METIKRKILLENYIDRAYNSKTYGTITASTFHINILLTQTLDDMGLFTDMPFIAGPKSKKVSDYYSFGGQRITGFTDSKIEDVRSYKADKPFQVGFNVATETYTNYSGGTVAGVDRVTKTGSVATYVFGTSKSDPFIGTSAQTKGLLYQDFSGSTRLVGEEVIDLTKVTYVGEGWNDTNTSIAALAKQEYLFGIISPPEVTSDVFIERGVTSIMDKHLRMSEISNLGELERYGNGLFKLNKQ